MTTMDDRTLIERAAKAAGYALRWNADWMGGQGCYQRQVLDKPDPILSDWLPWNPLTDDGDALRLAVKLRIVVEWDFDRVDASDSQGHHAVEFLYQKPQPTDIYAATRRAIVRAAASLAMGE